MAYKDKSAAVKYNNEFIKSAYDRINLTVPKGRKAELQTVAERHGQSVNGFINSLIDGALEQERARGVPAGAGGTCASVPAGSPECESTGAGVMVFPDGSPDSDISSRFISQWGPDFQTALADSGQSAEEYVTQAVRERVERESKPPIPQWIVERYPGERWPVLKAVRAIQGNMNAQRILHRSMTQEQQAEWDKEFRRELDEERREGAGQDTQKPTCNLPLD